MTDDSPKQEGLREVPANEILDKIQKGEPVEYDHIRIKGDLDLSKLDLPTEHVTRTEYQIKTLELPEESKVVSTSIKITNSKFDANANFNNTLFRGSVHFDDITFSGDAWFNGATFSKHAGFYGATFSGIAGFSGATFSGNAWFSGATFSGNAWFSGATFSGDAWFNGATVSGIAWFNGATVSGNAWFNGATFSGNAWFNGATFSEYAWFSGATFSEYAGFNGATFSKYAGFEGATFSGVAGFYGATVSEYAGFEGATFSEYAGFEGAKLEGDVLTFRDAIFTFANSQENACRRAKNVLEKNGNREEAGYHFYREMDAKRKQKPWYIRYPEFVAIQGIFGYGVHPWRLIYWWLLIVIVFSLIYSTGNGDVEDGIVQWYESYDYIKISFATAIAPGYIASIINPGSGGYTLLPKYQAVAMLETIVGTFLWAGFIATFARKYMR